MRGTRYNLFMQIKKVDWINRPARVGITAHTLSFTSSGEHKALYTLGTDGNLVLSYEGDDIGFLMLHTPADWIILRPGRIYGILFGLSFDIPAHVLSPLEIRKEGERINFTTDGRTVLDISNPAFRDSASFGFITGKDTKEAVLGFF